MSRYFLSHRATQPVHVDGRNYLFMPTTVSGNMVFGVYEAATPQAEADMARALKLGGVEEISLADFEAEKKRTPPSASSGSSPLRPVSLPQPSPSIDSVSLAASAPKPEKADPEKSVRIVNAAAVLRLGRVNSPSLVAESERLAP